MKKSILFLSALLLTLTAFASCGKTEKTEKTSDTGEIIETDTGTDTGTDEKHEHAYGELVEEKKATCTEDGNIAYYYCEGCQTYFDETKNAVEETAVVITKTGHLYGVDGKCTVCTETLSEFITQEKYIGNGEYDEMFKPVNGKCYFSFRAECTSEMYLYIDFAYEESYYYDEDFEGKTEQPNYIKSLEIYEEGSTTNLITTENYSEEFCTEGGSYWMYTVAGVFEREKTYTVVVNTVDDYDKEYVHLYWNLPFDHLFTIVGTCEYCGFDCSLSGRGGEGYYSFEPETPVTVSRDYTGVYVTFDLEVGNYHIKINGEEVDTTKYGIFVIIKTEGQTVYSQLPVTLGNGKSKNFTVTKAQKYCVEIVVKSQTLTVEKLELTVVA